VYSCFVSFFSISCYIFFVYFFFCVLLFFPTPLQVYRPLPPGGTPIALDKCNIISFLSTNNIFFTVKVMLSLPIRTQKRGLRVRNFVPSVYICVRVCVNTYIYKHTHAQTHTLGTKQQISVYPSPDPGILCRGS
jgi:hypothetical protein